MKNAKQLLEEFNGIIDIYEMASVASSENTFLAVNPDSSRGWYNEEYFKVYDAQNARKAQHIARIKFRTAEYTVHSNADGKETFKLNNKQKKELIKLLKSDSKKETGLTVWQYAILQFNLEAFEDANRDYCLNLTMKKQSEMKDQPEKYWLPIDLPMPDYMKL